MSERALAAEAAAALGIVAIGRIREQGSMVTPSQVAGVTTAYVGLSVVSMFGPGAAKVAGGIGGLILLSLAVVHGGAAISGLSGLANPKGVKLSDSSGSSSGPQIYQPGSGPAPATQYPYTFDNNTVIPVIP